MAGPALPLTQYLCHQWGGNNPIARALLGVVWNDLGTARKSGAHPGDRALRTFLRAWNPTEERQESGIFPTLAKQLRDTESQGCAWASREREASEASGPRQASQNPRLDPLYPKNLREILDACTKGTEPWRAHPQGASKPKSPQTHHPDSAEWHQVPETLRDGQSLLVAS